MAATYLVDELFQPSYLGIRSCLRSASNASVLPFRDTQLSTVSDRAFPLVATYTWNVLPHHLCQLSVAVWRPITFVLSLKWHYWTLQFIMSLSAAVKRQLSHDVLLCRVSVHEWLPTSVADGDSVHCSADGKLWHTARQQLTYPLHGQRSDYLSNTSSVDFN